MAHLSLSNGVTIGAALGGRTLDGDDPVVVLVHGAGMDRTVWQMQTRFLAFHGFRVVALDLPGHGLTGGEALPTIEAYASWLGDVIEALAVGPVHLAGHSMGGFIALELAADRPDLVRSLLLFGVAAKMPVHPVLIEAAENDDPLAGQLMSGWAFADRSKIGAHPSPGANMVGGTQALLENARPGVLANDLQASNAYEGALDAAKKVTAPTTIIIGGEDRMTPVKAAAPLLEALASGGSDPQQVLLHGVGHMMTLEAPRELRAVFEQALARGR